MNVGDPILIAADEHARVNGDAGFELLPIRSIGDRIVHGHGAHPVANLAGVDFGEVGLLIEAENLTPHRIFLGRRLEAEAASGIKTDDQAENRERQSHVSSVAPVGRVHIRITWVVIPPSANYLESCIPVVLNS